MKESIRQQKKKATRKKILDTAAALFAERGFGVSTGEVAKKAEVSHGLIFSHFATREKLIECIIGDFFNQLNVQIHTLAKGNAKMADLLYAHLSVLEQTELFYKRLITQLSELPKDTQNRLFGYQSVLSLHFEQALQSGMDGEEVKPVPFHMLFNMWMALVHYYIQNSEVFAPDGSVIQRYKDELVDTYLTMIQISR